MRTFVRETKLSADGFIYPLFVEEDLKKPEAILAMPGQYRWPVNSICKPVEEAYEAGVRAFLLFGSPGKKDATGSSSRDPDGAVPLALKKIRKACPDAILVTDVCLCAYTDHGHCGVIDDKGTILNDDTLPYLCEMALTHARHGADIIAPSDMMDGRIGAIRASLDVEGFVNVPIMAYAAKFSSCYYGPFREAAHSAPQSGDRKSYQMDPANRREALLEMELDLDEGADILMVKPAMAYLDIIREARDRFPVPIAAYQVSGEYSMIKAAAAKGWIDEEAAILESLTAIQRAGADIILTYFAPEATKCIQKRT